MILKKNKTGLSWTIRIFGFIVVLVCICASFVYSKLGNYSGIIESYNLAVNNYDRLESQKGLEALSESYSSFTDIGLQYIADRYLFKDMYKYEAATAIVNENYEKAIDLLNGHEDDPQALYMRGVAKFRVLHAVYHSEAAKKDSKIKTDILGQVLKDVSPDFCEAVKKGPGPSVDFNSTYNCDLTSNPDSAKMALEGVKPVPKYVLGVEEKGDANMPGSLPSNEKRIDESTPGSGDSRKKG